MNKLKQEALSNLKQAYIRMQGLQRVTAELAKARTKDDVASIIVGEGFTVLGADSGDVALITKEGHFEVLGSKGYPKNLLKTIPPPRLNPPLLTLQVVNTKKPYFIFDITQISKQYIYAKSFMEKVHAKSAALLPLSVNSEIIGVVQFTFSKEQTFDEEEKNFMMTLAQQCAQAVDRVTAQENLEASKTELEIILANIADGIIVQNGYGKIIYANKVFASLVSDIPENILLKTSWTDYLNLFDIFDEKGDIVLPHQMPGRSAIKNKKDVLTSLKFVRKVTGEVHWLKIGSSVIPHQDKEGPCVVSVFQDITALKELEQRKDDFISMASHELKTPLTSARVFTHVLKNRLINTVDKDSLKFVGKIDRQLDQLTDLTRQLLDITRLQKGKLELNKTRFSLDKLLQELVDDIQPSTHHPIQIKKIFPTYVYADKEKISQVITNFLTNAIKYSPEHRKITLTMEKNDAFVTARVHDFGIGIAKHDIGKIFDRFYRIEKDRKTYPGLGLGLYISSEIIKRHGGTIGVESIEGKESTFYFTLPFGGNKKT